MFQSRKQDYFNWKELSNLTNKKELEKFQSRKQDYFNWKPTNELWVPIVLEVSVPQAGLF